MAVTIRPITFPSPDRHAADPGKHAVSQQGSIPAGRQVHRIDGVVPTDPQPAPSTIDCAVCAHRHTSVCDDCVVTFILDRDPEDAVILDVEEERVVRMLGRAGLVPGVRHHLADRGTA